MIALQKLIILTVISAFETQYDGAIESATQLETIFVGLALTSRTDSAMFDKLSSNRRAVLP